jgi:hypothetical protein
MGGPSAFHEEEGEDMAEGKMLSMEQILAAPDVVEEVVFVPEWGGSVRIRSLTKMEQQLIRRKATAKNPTRTVAVGQVDNDRLEMLMLVASVVDPPMEEKHVEALRAKATGPVERILRAILKLNGMLAEAATEAEATFQEG